MDDKFLCLIPKTQKVHANFDTKSILYARYVNPPNNGQLSNYLGNNYHCREMPFDEVAMAMGIDDAVFILEEISSPGQSLTTECRKKVVEVFRRSFVIGDSAVFELTSGLKESMRSHEYIRLTNDPVIFVGHFTILAQALKHNRIIIDSKSPPCKGLFITCHAASLILCLIQASMTFYVPCKKLVPIGEARQYIKLLVQTARR